MDGRRLDDLEPSERPEWLASNFFISGIRRMPVRFRAGRRTGAGA